MAGVADQVFLRRIAGGVELVTGGKQVLLMGADIAKLDLFANLAGVTSVSSSTIRPAACAASGAR